jgi:hypothetical protein
MVLDTSLWTYNKDLIRFQFKIAERWLKRGKKSHDKFAKFFFHFSGFNALYYLWATIEDLKNEMGKRPGETRQIENLLKKFNREEAFEILNMLSEDINYFCKRNPIERMDKRDPTNPFDGDPEEGKKWQKLLQEREDSVDKMVALGEILYIIRSNLFHGSKSESGDDEEIINHSITPLEIILTKVLHLTENKFPWVK